MNKTQVTPNGVLEGMIRKRSGHIIGCKDRLDHFTVEKEAMADALLWLADNISDEMVVAMHDGPLGARGEEISATQRQWLIDMGSAALRAAAGSAPTPPEVK